MRVCWKVADNDLIRAVGVGEGGGGGYSVEGWMVGWFAFGLVVWLVVCLFRF